MKPEDKVWFEDIVGESLEEWRQRRHRMKEVENDISPKKSNVDHPNHYTWIPGIECKDVVGHFSYNIGSAIAYLWRHERKNGIEDLEKAIKHITFEIDRLYLSKQSGVSKSAPRESEFER